jgi:2-oxoglutarate ferredoxin oxidoreductase subunit alpha
MPYTVLVGGKAGEGVKKAAQVITQTCLRMGRYVFQSDDYQSLIKGGHNFSVVSTASEPVYSTYCQADLIICFDERSFQLHNSKLKPGGLIVYNSDESSSDTGIGIPFNQWVKEIYGAKANPSVAAFAIFAARTGQTEAHMTETISKAYKSSDDKNAVFSSRIYHYVADRLNHTHPLSSGAYLGKLYSGNQLIILGAWAAGMDFYYGYPMTPASSLMHYAAGLQEKLGIYTIHAESELAAINMAIGSTFAGCCSAVGSSGGGFALMQEAFSLAGMAEAPLLCILSSRPGPATGVSTYTAQEDLNFALHQGHGEFCRIVASPDSLERAFSLAAELLSLAWKNQLPTLLLTEKHLSESLMNVQTDPRQAAWAAADAPEQEADYQRYAIPDSGNGVSPLLFPPSKQSIKWNSHEHLPSGLRTDKAADMMQMKEKRHRKYQQVAEQVKQYQRVSIYGEGDILIFAYGSTALSIRETMKYLSKPVRLIVPIYLEPFPIDALCEFQGKPAIVVEYSIEGSFASFLQDKLAIQTRQQKQDRMQSTVIRKYDGRAFDPLELAAIIEELI